MTQLDSKFFKPFVDGTLNVLKVQCKLVVKPGEPFVKGAHPQPDFELAAVIGITSETFTGSITLCFPKKLFLTLMNNMLEDTFTEINQDLQSGAAELLNIIFGSAKAVLNKQGYVIQKAIPTVIQGSALKATYVGSSPVMVLPFTSAEGDFQIEISSEGQLFG